MPGPLTPPPVQHGTGRAVTQPTSEAAVKAAAAKYHVPEDILWGVYGMETGFGSNIATSPAGAIGAFQFLPSTARPYRYPLTNQPNAAQFQQQADAAAHYLHDLARQHNGDWDAALHGYSGGGYGLAQVKAKATGKQAQAFDAPTRAGSLAGGVSDAASTLADAAQVPAKFLHLLTDPQTWLRLVEMILGVALLLMGLKSFTGGAVDPAGLAAKVATRGAV